MCSVYSLLVDSKAEEKIMKRPSFQTGVFNLPLFEKKKKKTVTNNKNVSPIMDNF